ncbi:MAG: FISUMP domain-containing protein [Rikenellaceae bacterium]|nr:FISUMP domain-containing protein [Rikenellaceae bacterium]
MRQISFYFLPIVAVVMVFASSCNKDDDDSDSEYMDGSLLYECPEYLTTSTQITLNATGITDPTEGITYKWTMEGFSVDSLEGQNVVVTTPSETGDYTITVTASSDGYYSKTNSQAVTVIDLNSESSLKGLKKSGNFITDPRDGKTYYYSTIGSLDWFNYNLNYAGSGKAYENEEVLAIFMGRLYTWSEATGGVSGTGLGNGPQGVCPPGWSVPTAQDWEDLGKVLNNSAEVPFHDKWVGLGEKLTVNAQINDENIWKYSPNNVQNNLYTWNALPAGSMMSNLTRFENIFSFGFWWSSTEKNSNSGEYRYIYFDSPDFPFNYVAKEYFGASVRCVRKSL